MVTVRFKSLRFVIDVIFHLLHWLGFGKVHFSFQVILKVLLAISETQTSWIKVWIVLAHLACLVPKPCAHWQICNILNDVFTKTEGIESSVFHTLNKSSIDNSCFNVCGNCNFMPNVLDEILLISIRILLNYLKGRVYCDNNQNNTQF